LLSLLAALVELVTATTVLRDATPAVLLAGGAAALLAAALPIVATIAAVGARGSAAVPGVVL
jgi:hypothetical protein